MVEATGPEVNVFILLDTGGETLFLGMARLANYTDLDVQIRVQDTSAQVLTQTSWGLEVVLPPLLPGTHMISAFMNGVSIRSQG